MKYVLYSEDGTVQQVSDSYAFDFASNSLALDCSKRSNADLQQVDQVLCEVPDPFTNINQIDASERVNCLPDDYLKAVAKQQAQSEIRDQARAAIIAIANSLGVTDRPISWTQVNAKVAAMMQSPDPATIMQALALSAQLQSNYLFFKDNGGDPWTV